MKSEYFKDFDNWNNSKKQINALDVGPFFNEGEIWWCAIGVNVDIEIDGKNDYFERPVLIIKKINLQSAIIAPITNSFRNNAYVYPLKTISSNVVISQIRNISNKRLSRRICRISLEEYAQIIIRIIYLFNYKNETPP